MQRLIERVASYGPECSPQCCHTGGIVRWYAFLTMKRIERIRLYPTPHQAAHLALMLDVTRQLYNALLEQRRDA
jgi:Helix-turn-helix domain